MESPQGVSNPKGLVCQLQKGLYGLKQSARVWNQRFTKELRNLGLRPVIADQSVWISKDQQLFLALYVDDIVLFARYIHALLQLKRSLAESFKMKDLGEVRNVLGLRIRRCRTSRRVWIDQAPYIRDILRESNLEHCRQIRTPADGYENLHLSTDNDDEFPDISLYQRTIGQLNWLVRGTRPDLAFVVHKLSQFCHRPQKRHWNGVKRVLRYLNCSQQLALRYESQGERISLEGYSDTDFAADISDRKSTMGYVFMLNGAAVTWSARKQQTTSTSTTEAEYIGLCDAAKEAVWIRNLLQGIGRKDYAGEARATLIYGDNQSSLRLVENPEFHARSKHIAVGYHYVRELKEAGYIAVEYIPTERMLADCFTKPLKKQKLNRNLEGLGLREDTDGYHLTRSGSVEVS